MKSILAGLALLLLAAPLASATSSSVVIGYYQGFPLKVDAVEGQQCSVSGVPTASGFTAPSTGQTLIAFTPNTGVHTIPIQASEGFTAVDAILTPNAALGIEQQGGLSLAFNATAASVGDVASVTVILQTTDGGTFNCSTTVTFTLVEAPSTCDTPPTPPPSGSIPPYPPSGPPLVQNPSVSVTIITQVVQIVNVQNNINIQTTVNNYNNFVCNCCFNSCNTIVVTPPAPPTPTVSPTPASPGATPTPPPPEGASPPEASPPEASPPEESAPPPVIVENPPPPPEGEAPAPAPETEEDTGSS